HACTDITGFGLIGHTCQLARNSQVGIKIHVDSMPFFIEAEEFAKAGFCPGGLHRNREFYSEMVDFSDQVPDYMKDILFDPQTSGGLLISLAPEAAEVLMDRLKEAEIQNTAIIGEVVSKPPGKVLVG
ncbi:MAG: selenide, water dikinase SelD, partial [Dehalococcoidia bacterium]|nr:selenide, water dikinase SelD [Dehalococcoidia bacterium]